MFSDNNSVVPDSSLPNYTLKKKRNTIAYYALQWATDDRDMRVCFKHVNSNMADMLTKNLDNTKHSIFRSCIL